MATNNAVNVSLSGQTGTGSFVGSNSPTLVTPALGTPSSVTLTNGTGLPISSGVSGLGTGIATFLGVNIGNSSTIVSSSAGVASWAAMTNGQVIIGNTGGTPTAATLTAGANITITNAGGSITIASPGAGGSGGLINVQRFTSSGTYTPTANLTFALVVCIGGGGAGGGSSIANTNFAYTSAGSGGGSGGFSQSYVSAATIGASKTVTIGAGGTGSAGANGGNGGTTSVGSIVIANGGSGGIYGGAAAAYNAIPGGAGATAGTGDVALPGTPGGNSLWSADASSTLMGFSGLGGNSVYGNGAINIATTASSVTAGNAATANTGAGGSGAMLSVQALTGAAQAGGNGGSGFVIIYEYGT